MNSLNFAFSFLTVFPVPTTETLEREELIKGVYCFPAIGAVLGILLYLFSIFLPNSFSTELVSFFVILGLACMTGAFHLDGLADTADGFFSSRPKEQMLDIMRDSRIGAMGVLALIFVVLLKWIALNQLLTMNLWFVIFLMPIAGRCFMIMPMVLIPYIREQGLGSDLWLFARTKSLIVLPALYLVCLVIGGFSAAFSAILCTALVYGFAKYCEYKIDGGTGDTVGACVELSEASFLVTLIMLAG